MTFEFKEDKTNSYVFTKQEMQDINELREGYESLTEREKFIAKEALKPYFYGKKT